MALLSEADGKKVADAVARAEKSTAGELVVVCARRSDDYGATRGVLSLLLALGATQEAHYLWPEQPFVYLLLLLAFVCVCLYWLFGVGPVLRSVVPSSRRSARVMERALQAFAEEGVCNTRDRSGVLIFLSEAERRVVILADTGIDERVEKDEWENDVNSLLTAIKRGETRQGLVAAVERIGGILAEVFPARPDDENELSNEVRRR
jgi:putative membrane protein